jgi:mitogen-activated protein kinase organizer 1
MTSDYLGRSSHIRSLGRLLTPYIDPVTAVQPTQDAQTLLITTLSSTIRLLDRKTGQALNTFKGHVHESYRCRATLDGKKEENVIIGDEEGRVWAWDLVNVSCPHRSSRVK